MDTTDSPDKTCGTDSTLPTDAEKSAAAGSGRMLREMAADEKPREKALAYGMDALTDTELLAILLGSGMQGKSVLELSGEILRDVNYKLSHLSRLSIAEIRKRWKGVGTAKATLLSAAITFGSRVQQSLAVPDEQLRTSAEVYAYMRHRLERLNHEEFWVLHLSHANRVMRSERVGQGGISATAVDARLIAKSALDNMSSGLILVHNHPSGTNRPSGPDDAVTRKIADICKIIDVKVLDHLIISPTGYYSYRDEGRL